MKKLYILDVSGYIFRSYFALPAMTSPTGESSQGLYGFIRSILKLFKELNPENIVAVFDGPNNKKQRKEIYEEYKANRVKVYEDLPEQINRAKEFCKLIGIPFLEVPEVEADDAIGSIACWAKKHYQTIYICTSDKDFCQLVGDNVYVLNTWKDNLLIDAQKVQELYGVFPHQMTDFLAIAGDSSDNIPGLKGFGPKTAVGLLQEYGTLENVLANVDNIKGAKKQQTLREESEIAFLSKKLATIRTDINFPQDISFFTKSASNEEELREFYIKMGFFSLAKEGEKKLPVQEDLSYNLVNSNSDLEKLLSYLEQHKYICFDLETTSVKPLMAQPVGIGFSVKSKEGFYVPFNGNIDHNTILSALDQLFSNPYLQFFGHNVKYDLHVLENCNISVKNICFDTMLASYLLHSDNHRHSLDVLCLQHFGKTKIDIKELIGSGKKILTMDQVAIDKVSKYCCEDVDYTFRLKELLEKEIYSRKLDKLLSTLELPLTRVLMKMERAGVFVDVEQLSTFSAELGLEIEQVEKEIYALADEVFNINSPKQLSYILFEKLNIKPLKKTTTALLSTRADVLESLSKEHPIAEKLLLFRSLTKLRSTYVDALPLSINPNTSRIHPTFTQFVAATGRLACQDPNLQNIPARTKQGLRIRKAFMPQKKGWSYLAADYSQIELRLLAHLSEDKSLIKAFKHGEDIHTHTASLMFDVPLEKVSKEQRQQAKAINFGIVYGQQAYGLSQELGIDVSDADKFITDYFARYPRVRDFIDMSILSARETGKSITISGREREIPDINSTNAIARKAAERLAINTPLQGSAADIIKLVMLSIDRKIEKKNLKSFLILQIHDELIFEAPDFELVELQDLVKVEMESVVSLQVPLVVNVAIGKNWAEC